MQIRQSLLMKTTVLLHRQGFPWLRIFAFTWRCEKPYTFTEKYSLNFDLFPGSGSPVNLCVALSHSSWSDHEGKQLGLELVLGQNPTLHPHTPFVGLIQKSPEVMVFILFVTESECVA